MSSIICCSSDLLCPIQSSEVGVQVASVVGWFVCAVGCSFGLTPAQYNSCCLSTYIGVDLLYKLPSALYATPVFISTLSGVSSFTDCGVVIGNTHLQSVGVVGC
jgi:hypothetical protein